MSNSPLITFVDFVDNRERELLVYKKGNEKGLDINEKHDAFQLLSDSLIANISTIEGLQDRVRFNVVNILDYQNVPKEIEGDAFIFGGFPNIGNVGDDFVNGLKGIVRDIVDRQNKPFLGICFGHQLLAETYGGELAVMDKRIIGADEIILNNEGMRDSLFSQLNTKSFGSIWWHKRRIASIGTDTKVLGGNAKGEFQVIKVGDNARGIQSHPDFTIHGAAGLVKLGVNGITREGNSPEVIIEGLRNNGFRNDSSRIIGEFVKKVVGE